MLIQLIYLSKRKTDEAEIQNILEKSVEKNKKLEVSGFLIYSENFFLQCIEGEKDKVLPLYETIKKDDRHSNIFMISYRLIQKRDFPDWAMGQKKISSSEINLLPNFNEEEKKVFEQILQGSQNNRAIDILKKFSESI